MAKGLISIGVKPGDKVGIWATNVPDWSTFMFATAKIGAILVTVNTSYKLSELEYIIKNADLHTICIIDGYRDSDYVNMLFELVPELRSCVRGELVSSRFPELKNVVFIGPQKHKGMYNTHELMLIGAYASDDELNHRKSVIS